MNQHYDTAYLIKWVASSRWPYLYYTTRKNDGVKINWSNSRIKIEFIRRPWFSFSSSVVATCEKNIKSRYEKPSHYCEEHYHVEWPSRALDKNALKFKIIYWAAQILVVSYNLCGIWYTVYPVILVKPRLHNETIDIK